jgi:DNA-binding Xre family transcriptional regulator
MRNSNELNNVAVSYNRLWKLLIDKKMKKKELQSAGVLAPA